jgi:AcrR family transcriptional regulator
MARPRLIPDTAIFASVRSLLAAGGDKAVAFAAVARETGLAGPTLVQRYGSRDAMLRAALLDGWNALDAATARAEGMAEMNAKGALALIRALETVDPAFMAAGLRDSTLRARAATWRAQTEAALAARLGGGPKGRDAAAALFALWQGQMLWQDAGGKTFRLKEAMKRLT